MSNEFERLMDDLDPEQGGPLLTLTSKERHDVARFIEKLRQWGRYNTVMTDLSPFLTDAKTVIEGELSREILQYAKETGEFPVNMVDFIKTQPKPLGYIWENSQKMRDLMTRAAIRFIEMNDNISTNKINEIFPQLARKIYTTILTGPYLGRAKQSFERMGDEPY
tara:strand:- start:1207 stop:1701 length:495 start_codon:yes stop_codon:yes gene_type:complete